jgi:3D (Asp-Asp-Asp) domain-containing protein
MSKAVMVIFTMIALLCVGEQISSAYFNQEVNTKISNPGAPESDMTLKAELENALKIDSEVNSEPKEEPEISPEDMDFISTMEERLLAKEKVQKFELAVISFTAYYGPRKNQKKYYDKTYAKDVARNGPGLQTACKGEKPDQETIATDPKKFPCGTKIIMTDPLTGKEKTYVAKDKGSAIKGFKIDIFAGFGTGGLENVRKIERKPSTDILVKVIRPKKVRA